MSRHSQFHVDLRRLVEMQAQADADLATLKDRIGQTEVRVVYAPGGMIQPGPGGVAVTGCTELVPFVLSLTSSRTAGTASFIWNPSVSLWLGCLTVPSGPSFGTIYTACGAPNADGTQHTALVYRLNQSLLLQRKMAQLSCNNFSDEFYFATDCPADLTDLLPFGPSNPPPGSRVPGTNYTETRDNSGATSGSLACSPFQYVTDLVFGDGSHETVTIRA